MSKPSVSPWVHTAVWRNNQPLGLGNFLTDAKPKVEISTPITIVYDISRSNKLRRITFTFEDFLYTLVYFVYSLLYIQFWPSLDWIDEQWVDWSLDVTRSFRYILIELKDIPIYEENK